MLYTAEAAIIVWTLGVFMLDWILEDIALYEPEVFYEEASSLTARSRCSAWGRYRRRRIRWRA